MTEVLTEVLPQKSYKKVLHIIEYLEKWGNYATGGRNDDWKI